MIWEHGTFKVRDARFNYVDVAGYISGPFGIYKAKFSSLSGAWRIINIPTCLEVCPRYAARTLKAAKTACEDLAPLTDWSAITYETATRELKDSTYQVLGV